MSDPRAIIYIWRIQTIRLHVHVRTVVIGPEEIGPSTGTSPSLLSPLSSGREEVVCVKCISPSSHANSASLAWLKLTELISESFSFTCGGGVDQMNNTVVLW